VNVVDYPLPKNGLGSDFSEYERPLNFAKTYTNRFRNINGGAEKRPGMSRLAAAVTGAPNLTRLHEHVGETGTETLLSSDDNGNIWRLNTSAAAWDAARTGGSNERYISAEADGKLILVNGTDRNIYTDDGGATFRELKAIITRGVLAAGTTTSAAVDGDISNWSGATLVTLNDIVYNVTRNGYGIVTAIASASLSHTPINTNSGGAGLVVSDQAAGDVYEVIDHIDLNIIPQGGGLKDNTATAGPGTTAAVIAVSGLDFSTTEIRTGDIVYNTTRAQIALIGSVSANINMAPSNISGQVAGDALAFFKSAMPIASWVHVHYGRVYYLDARNNRRVPISAPDDPEDLTTFAQTLDATSFDFGSQQPTGDTILTLGTFQGYFAAGGRRNLYIYKGATPIRDTSTTTLDFTPTAFYPNGVASRFGLATNGSDLLHITNEGLQAVNIGNVSNTTIQSNVSTPIRRELLGFISQANADDVQLTHYPRRSWSINKIGDRCYILNTSPSYSDTGQLENIVSWHPFTGKWGQQNHYFVRRNGDLLACGAGGLVYQMDSSAATDDGTPIATDLTTSWLRLEEPQRSKRIKQGRYIAPVFESSPGLPYTINAVAGWDNLSTDSIVVSAAGGGEIGSFVVGSTPIGGGNLAQSGKHPLRWRGEQVRVQFTTNTSASPDIITGFSLYGDIGGYR